MISLEQVKALEIRVEKAVGLIDSLRSENASLRAGLEGAESRVHQLEDMISAFQKDQARIEEGIVQALKKLDLFEDGLHSRSSQAPAVSSEPGAQTERKPVSRPQESAPEPVETASKAEKADGSAAQVPREAPGSDDDKPTDALDIF